MVRRYRTFLFVLVVFCLGSGIDPCNYLSARGDSINIFDKKNTDKPKKKKQPGKEEIQTFRRLSQSFEDALNPDTQQKQSEFFHYLIFFMCFGLFIAGLVFLRIFWQKRAEQTLVAPEYLVRELNTAHQLTREEISVMQKAAAAKTDFAVLDVFVEPSRLLTALDEKTFSDSRHVIRSLLSKLFDYDTAAVSGITRVDNDNITQIGTLRE